MKEMKNPLCEEQTGADAIYDESVEYLTDQVNTAALPGNSEKIPFVVWNTSGNREKTGHCKRTASVPRLQSVCMGWL